MNAGSIWWGQIGNSLQLLTNVTNALRDCQSAVLQVPQEFPWRHDFYEAIDIKRSSFGGEKRLMRLVWSDGEDPGEFVLDELCSNRVRADYWPGQTYAEYLGSKDDILLNDYYVWVSGIHSKADASKWIEFVVQYNQASNVLENRAVFILEYDGVGMDVVGIENLVYTVENYDCRVFCLEAAAALNNSRIRAYQAELALCVGGDNPELCSALLDCGDKFLQNPLKISAEILDSGINSEGKHFAMQNEQQLNSAAWKAAILLLFPILEQFRLDFISTHEHALARYLPISNSNGDRVTDPYDLEIGPIQYIVSNANGEFTADEIESIRLCRKVRNMLAHNKPVPFEDVKRILN